MMINSTRAHSFTFLFKPKVEALLNSFLLPTSQQKIQDDVEGMDEACVVDLHHCLFTDALCFDWTNGL